MWKSDTASATIEYTILCILHTSTAEVETSSKDRRIVGDMHILTNRLLNEDRKED